MERFRQRPSEDELIARFFAPMAGEGGLGLKDDAACLRPAPGHDLVLTVDGLTAGIHFLADDRPQSIARKALAVNVSDLAAKAAEPSGFLLTLALPDDWTEAWLAGFAEGLAEAADAFRCPLLGGDTVRANGPLWLSVTALGQVAAGRMVPRGGAQPGDRLCVTGTIGDAALGLALRRGERPAWAARLSPDEQHALVDRYLHPRPRLAVATALGQARQGGDGRVGRARRRSRQDDARRRHHRMPSMSPRSLCRPPRGRRSPATRISSSAW